MIKPPSQNRDSDQKLVHELNSHLPGCKILSFSPPTRNEHIFVLKVEYPGGETQNIEFGATELGWWIDEPFVGKHRMRKYGYRGEVFETCENCHKAAEDEDFDPGGCQPARL